MAELLDRLRVSEAVKNRLKQQVPNTQFTSFLILKGVDSMQSIALYTEAFAKELNKVWVFLNSQNILSSSYKKICAELCEVAVELLRLTPGLSTDNQKIVLAAVQKFIMDKNAANEKSNYQLEENVQLFNEILRIMDKPELGIKKP